MRVRSKSLDRPWAECVWNDLDIPIPWGRTIEVGIDIGLEGTSDDLQRVRWEAGTARRPRFLVPTEDPERLRALLGEVGVQHMSQAARWIILAAVCRTDAELQFRARMLPRGANSRCPALVLEPAERMDLASALMGSDMVPRWVLLRSRRGQGVDGKPMHPAWLESIVQDARTLGVPLWFEGWGNWVPYDGGRANDRAPIVELFTDGHVADAGQRRHSAGVGAQRFIFRPGTARPEVYGRELREEPPSCA